jgi:hypothetical protein
MSGISRLNVITKTDYLPLLKFVSKKDQNFKIFLVNCYGGSGRIIIFASTKADANALMVSSDITHELEVMHGDIA